MSEIKSYDSYTIEVPIVKTGRFISKNGDEISLNNDDIDAIFDQINQEIPLINSHTNRAELGKVVKYIKRNGDIWAKASINDSTSFKDARKNGFNYVSPELSIDIDNFGKPIASLETLALSANPGMIKDEYMVSTYHFDNSDVNVNNESVTQTTPIVTPSQSATPPTVAQPDWHDPLSKISEQISSMSSQIKSLGEKKAMTEEPTNDKVTMTRDELQALINDSIKSAMSSAKPTEPIVENEVVEETPVTPTVDPVVNEKLTKLQNDYDKLLKKQKGDLITELKGLGVEAPDDLITDSGLDLSQQIAQLEKFKKLVAKKTPISQPMEESISPLSEAKQSNQISIDEALTAINATGNPTLRNMFLKLTDADELRRFNMPRYFDDNGKFIG